MAKPTRRRFSAEYRLRILEEADRCIQPGEIQSAASRGLVQLAFVRLAQGAPQRFAQGPDTEKTRRQAGRPNPLSGKVRQLEAKVTRLEKELATAHTIIDVQGKVAGLLGLNLNDGKNC